MKKQLLKFLIGGAFLFTATLAHASGPFRPVMLSTNPVTQQSGAFNVVSGSMTSLSVTGTAALVNTSISSMTASPNMGSHKFTNMAAGTANGDSLRFEQMHLLQAPVFCSETTGGTTTSSAFSNKGVTCGITPTDAGSTIIGFEEAPISIGSAGKLAQMGVSGTTTGDLYTVVNSPAWYRQVTGDVSSQGFSISLFFKDTPGTLTPQTYSMRIASNDNASTVFVGNSVFTGAKTIMVLFEMK